MWGWPSGGGWRRSGRGLRVRCGEGGHLDVEGVSEETSKFEMGLLPFGMVVDSP